MTPPAAKTLSRSTLSLAAVLTGVLVLLYLLQGRSQATDLLAVVTVALLAMGILGELTRLAGILGTSGPSALAAATLTEAQGHAKLARIKYPEYRENTHHDWLRAAAEELGECSKTIHNGGMTQEEMDHLREEILQLGATALNWADSADFSPTQPGQRA